MPEIKRAARITGASLVLRDVETADAGFIIGLRRTEGKSRFIGETSADLDLQRRYIETYRDSRDTAYFLICDPRGRRLGTVRLYDPVGNSFSWGSWVLAGDSPSRAGIESALIVYVYGIDVLGFKAAHFAVMRANERVWHFHERFGAQRTSETEEEVFYSIDEGTIRASLKRYGKFLPRGIEVSI